MVHVCTHTHGGAGFNNMSFLWKVTLEGRCVMGNSKGFKESDGPASSLWFTSGFMASLSFSLSKTLTSSQPPLQSFISEMRGKNKIREESEER